MAGGQQVWVTWSGSKLLHKSHLKVDLLGGAISLKQKKTKLGALSCSVPTLHLAEVDWSSTRFGLSLGAHAALGGTPLPEDDRSWHFSRAFLLRTSEHFTTLGEMQ